MRLIDAEALENDVQEKIGYLYGVTKFIKMINEQPTIEAKPIVHAHWNDDGRCTNCGEHAPFLLWADTWHESEYCHGCGAQMDELVSNTDKLNSSVKIPVISMEDVPKIAKEMEK